MRKISVKEIIIFYAFLKIEIKVVSRYVKMQLLHCVTICVKMYEFRKFQI